MQADDPAAKTAEWFRRDAERNERARLERLRIDGRKSVGQNIEEGAALIVLGFEVQRAFEHTRRCRARSAARAELAGHALKGGPPTAPCARAILVPPRSRPRGPS